MIITIDGPSGTGKSTVARKVAERLHFVYFDTGAMYRALTWFFLENNISIENSEAIDLLLKDFHFEIREERGEKKYFVNQHDVTEIIRSRWITSEVSKISALKQVRQSLLDVQRQFAEKQNAVFEGRDIGSVVFPHAEVKIFLDADPRIRAERRLAELIKKNTNETEKLNSEMMLKEIIERDAFDSTREIAPLKCPSEAFKIDTTHLSIDEVVSLILNHFSKYKGH